MTGAIADTLYCNKTLDKHESVLIMLLIARSLSKEHTVRMLQYVIKDARSEPMYLLEHTRLPDTNPTQSRRDIQDQPIHQSWAKLGSADTRSDSRITSMLSACKTVNKLSRFK